MKELNSVLLDGHLVSDPKPAGQGVFLLDIMNNGQSFTIAAAGKLADACELLTTGRGIRVIGTIEHPEAGIRIAAEHIEFKPCGKKEVQA
ncbi:MAG: hypothetical protein AB7T74_04810 [Clostridia bacterium]